MSRHFTLQNVLQRVSVNSDMPNESLHRSLLRLMLLVVHSATAAMSLLPKYEQAIYVDMICKSTEAHQT
eukprot:837454-Amphidinium_carterae.1